MQRGRMSVLQQMSQVRSRAPVLVLILHTREHTNTPEMEESLEMWARYKDAGMREKIMKSVIEVDLQMRKTW